MRKPFGSILAGSAAAFFCTCVQAQGPLPGDSPQDVLAAQIRVQGFSCEKPLGATRDTKRSKSDRAVWVLKCNNAMYRVSRFPDMAAKVEPLR